MNKSDILNAGALRQGAVEVEGVVYNIREASVAVTDVAYRAYTESGPLTSNAFLVVHCLVDDDGKRIFSDDDVEKVKELKPSFISPIAQAITAISEELEKN